MLLVVFAGVERVVTEPMVDASLFRVPTFTGGLVAAWGISAAMFSLLTYIVIYLQGTMGYSALQAGLYFLPFSGLVFVSAAVAGRLSDKVPARWLITPGFLLVAVGLLLMRGTDPTGGWTQFIPGFVVAGIGTGLINVPLASTAVGVVEQSRAGMASGMNSTFRQIGIATGVALLGSLLASRLSSDVQQGLAGTPLADRGREIGDAVANGAAAQVISSVPAPLRELVAARAGQGYADALDLILLIATCIAWLPLSAPPCSSGLRISTRLGWRRRRPRIPGWRTPSPDRRRHAAPVQWDQPAERAGSRSSVRVVAVSPGRRLAT